VAARPITIPYTLIARTRCDPVYTTPRIDKMLGAISAAPTPWTTRAATSTDASGAAAHATEVMTKTAIPMVNIRRRPNMSPSRPPVTSRTAVEIA